MPEHDAFGREIGEDPLADLGWGPSPSPSPSPPPPPAPVPPAVPRSRSGSAGRTIRWLVALAALAALGLGAGSVISAGTQAIQDVTDVMPAPPDAGDGAGDAPRSLLRPGALERTLGVLADEAPGRLSTLRLDPGRISLTQYVRGGKLRVVTIAAGDRGPTVVSTSRGGGPPTDVFSHEDLRPKAVARALRVAEERTGKGPGRVDYLVFTASGGQRTWGVYYRGGQIVQTDARGRFVRKVS